MCERNPENRKAHDGQLWKNASQQASEATEEVNHLHVSLLCSTQVGSPSVSLWYVLCTGLTVTDLMKGGI